MEFLVFRSPANSRQLPERQSARFSSPEYYRLEHCVGSACGANLLDSADKSLKEIRQPLSEYGSTFYGSFGLRVFIQR